MSGKPHPTQPESNAVLFSAEERILRLKLGMWGELEQTRLSMAIEKNCIQNNKLIRPAPWTQDAEAPDDHIGLGACGYASPIAFVLFYFFKNISYLQYFVLRFSAIIAHLQWASGSAPSLFRRAYWAISVGYWPIDPKAQDPWIQNWLLVEVAGDRGWMEHMASKRFWKRLRQAWPGGLAEVFTAYWNAEHPIVKACKELGI